jgi:hypothetical protein
MFAGPPSKVARTQRSEEPQIRRVLKQRDAIDCMRSDLVRFAVVSPHVCATMDEGMISFWSPPQGEQHHRFEKTAVISQVPWKTKDVVGVGADREFLVIASRDGTLSLVSAQATFKSFAMLQDGEQLKDFVCKEGTCVALTAGPKVLIGKASDESSWFQVEIPSPHTEMPKASANKPSGWSFASLLGLSRPAESEKPMPTAPDDLQLSLSRKGNFLFVISEEGSSLTTFSLNAKQAHSLSKTKLDSMQFLAIDVDDSGLAFALVRDCTQSEPQLVLATLSITSGKLYSPSLCIRQYMDGLQYDCSVLSGRGIVGIAAGSDFYLVHATNGIRGNENIFCERLNDRILATFFGSPSILLTSSGFFMPRTEFPTAGNPAPRNPETDIIAAVGSRHTPDDVALRLSEEIVLSELAHVGNWARTDLDVEDADQRANVTQHLFQRLQLHNAFLNRVFASPETVELLSESCVAALCSDHEQLFVLSKWRELQNEECETFEVLNRQQLLKDLILEVAKLVASGSSTFSMTAAEKVYSTTKSVPKVLQCLAERLTQVAESATGADTKITFATSAVGILTSMIEGIEGARLSFGSGEVLPLMWTANAEVQRVFHSIACSISDLLTLMAVTNPQESDRSANACNGVAVIYKWLLRQQPHLCLPFCLRTLVRSPYLTTPFGYPFGQPHPAELNGNRMGKWALELSEELAFQCKCYDLLFLFSLSEAQPADFTVVRRFIERDPDCYLAFLRLLLASGRETGILALRESIPELIQISDSFLAAEAPHLHFLVDPQTARSSLIVDGVVPKGEQLGLDVVEHRLNTLALAKLCWVSDSRPRASIHLLEAELEITRAQLTHTQERQQNLDAEGVINILHQNGTLPARLNAVKVAEMVLDEDLRGRLLVTCLLNACLMEKSTLEQIDADKGSSELEFRRAVEKTVSAQVCKASAVIQSWLLTREPNVRAKCVAEGAAKEWNVLTKWIHHAFRE